MSIPDSSIRALLITKSPNLVPTDQALRDVLLTHRGLRVQTINLHHLALAKSDQAFRTAILRADRVTADGWPVRSAFVALGEETERVTGSHLVSSLLQDARSGQKRFGLLGASPETGQAFTELMSEASRSLVFADHRDKSQWDPRVIADTLNKLSVDILLIAVTPPFGETFASSLMDGGFRGNVVAIGGSIDMITGRVRPCPRWLQLMKLEWSFRLVQEPRRLFHRYFVQCIPTMLVDIAPIIASDRIRLTRSH